MTSRQLKLNDYDGFVDKFKHKKTTDDCYTPPAIYDAVVDYVNKYVTPLDGLNILRPFYPGGDYEAVDYQPNDVVIDNPPFSILAQIIDFYRVNHIKFFLFAPSLTLFGYGSRPDVTCVVANAKVVYENGAVVGTSFLTNMLGADIAFVAEPRLSRTLEAIDKARPSRKVQKLSYPDHVVTSALLHKSIKYLDEPWVVRRESCAFVRGLDCGQSVFGGGFLLSERAAAERAAAERAAAERAAAERAATKRCPLSDHELNIIRRLK